MSDDKKLYTLYQGCHYSGFRFRPVFRQVNWLFIDFKFAKNSLYKFDEPDADTAINKLFGLSFGHHHKRSVRIGWNCNPDGKRIDLYAYIYEIKQYTPHSMPLNNRWSQFLCSIDICQDYTATIRFNYTKRKVLIQVRKYLEKHYPVNQNVVGDTELYLPLPEGKIFPIKYLLYPYFGGKKTAPHNINILLSHTLI